MSISAVTPKAFTHSYSPICSNFTARDINRLIEDQGKKVLNYQFSDLDGNVHAPLYYALAYWGNAELVRRLIWLGADVDALDPLGGTALHAFINRLKLFPADLDLLAYLIENTHDINAPNAEGFTPLHAAIFNGSNGSIEPDWEVIARLLKRGANPNATTSDGRTPLDLLLEKTAHLTLPELRHWAERLLGLFEKDALIVPRAIALDEVQKELKGQLEPLKTLPIDFLQPGLLPNPRLGLPRHVLKRGIQREFKDRGCDLLQTRKALLNDIIIRLTPYYYRWRWSDCPAFSAFFDKESFAFLQKLSVGDAELHSMLNAQKKLPDAAADNNNG